MLRVPAAQGRQPPVEAEYVPAAQGWQEVAPGAKVLVPGGQGVQVEAPAPLEKVPLAQSVALAEEGGQAEPAGQEGQHDWAFEGTQFHAKVVPRKV